MVYMDKYEIFFTKISPNCHDYVFIDQALEKCKYKDPDFRSPFFCGPEGCPKLRRWMKENAEL